MDLAQFGANSPQLIILAFAICAGLCLRQTGLVRRSYALSADLQCLTVFVAGCLAFWAFGFVLLGSATEAGAVWPEVVGTISLFQLPPSQGRSFFLDMAIAAIVGQAVAGALAERMRILPLIVFALVVTGVIFPIVASWQWGGGWLAKLGFIDFGGATLVHSTAGWAALAGTIVLGGRLGRFDPNHQLDDAAHQSLIVAALGTVIVAIGWQGAIAGMRAGIGVGLPMPELGPLLANINASALAGGLVALAVGFVMDRQRMIPIALNGVVAGLVAISADPVQSGIVLSLVIGAVAGVLAAVVQKLVELARLDDVTDAITAHLAAGIWGTLAVCFSAPGASLVTQLTGIAAVGLFSFVSSFALFLVLQLLLGLRAPPLETSAQSRHA